MNDKEYFGAEALSKSMIKRWEAHNPTAFWKKCVWNPNKDEETNTNATVFGKLTHMMLFQRDLVTSAFEVNDDLGKSRINKKWIEAQASSDKLFISTEELNKATLMIEALLKQGEVLNLLKYAKVEAPFFWHDKVWDIPCKMRTDAETGSEEGIYCIDYKCTGKEFPRYIDKEAYQFEIGMYSRGLGIKYGKPVKKFIHILQSLNDGEENKISIRVTEGAQLECCEIITDKAVREIVPKIKEWMAKPEEKIWLPNVIAQSWEISLWYESNLEKGNN